jgi:hypothetical protein
MFFVHNKCTCDFILFYFILFFQSTKQVRAPDGTEQWDLCIKWAVLLTGVKVFFLLRELP